MVFATPNDKRFWCSGVFVLDPALKVFLFLACRFAAMASRRIFVGNLPQDIRERELEDIFYKYGRISEIDLKLPPRPPGFAFIEFEDPRDAIAAVQGRDGYDFYGSRLRV